MRSTTTEHRWTGRGVAALRVSHDEGGRKIAENGFNADEPFLTSSYDYDDDGRLIAQTVRYTIDAATFSDRAYEYSADTSLARITLISPFLGVAIVDAFEFDGADGRLVARRDIDRDIGLVDSSETFTYDEAGSLSTRTRHRHGLTIRSAVLTTPASVR